jgi:hypothetical protein
MPSLEVISEASAQVNEKLAKDMRDMDWYWMNGRLEEWIAKQVEEEKESVGDTIGNT